MKESQEAAAEAKAKRRGGLGLVFEARVVEAKLGETIAQLLVIGGIRREEAAEHDRLHGLEAGQRLGRRPALLCDGVANLAIRDRLDAGSHEADLARPELRHRRRFRREDANALDDMA